MLVDGDLLVNKDYKENLDQQDLMALEVEQDHQVP